MDACCQLKSAEVENLRASHKRVLTIVLAINAVLFVVEATAGLLAHSTSLLADSLDMLGDSLVYGFSLYVLSRNASWRTLAAISKGALMGLFGLGVLVEAVYKWFADIVPSAPTMGVVGILVLLGNGLCFFLLYRHRADDLNMRSTWLCSRNDIVANLSVLAAALGVWAFNAFWPDLLIGAAIAILFLRTALTVLRESISEYRRLNDELKGLSAESTVTGQGVPQD